MLFLNAAVHQSIAQPAERIVQKTLGSKAHKSARGDGVQKLALLLPVMFHRSINPFGEGACSLGLQSSLVIRVEMLLSSEVVRLAKQRGLTSPATQACLDLVPSEIDRYLNKRLKSETYSYSFQLLSGFCGGVEAERNTAA